MTKVLKFKPPGQAVSPKTSQYGDFSRRNFTFIVKRNHCFDMEWIALKDRQPEIKGHYLCVKAGYLPFCAVWRDRFDGRGFQFYYDGEKSYPTHWLPLDELNLPEPPQL